MNGCKNGKVENKCTPIPWHDFLAIMNSSRTDDVTKSVSVCRWEVILFSLKHSNHLKQDVSVSRVLEGCSKGIFEGVSKVF